jgi:Rrf2 family protein
MKMSTKARYGTRALLDIAMHKDESLVKLKDVAQRQQISLYYLQQLIAPLRTAGLVKSAPGIHGGIRLGKRPEDVMLSEVIQALEGSLAPVDCVDDTEVCARADLCVTRDIWTKMKDAMTEVLASTSLQDLVDRQTRKVEALRSNGPDFVSDITDGH